MSPEQKNKQTWICCFNAYIQMTRLMVKLRCFRISLFQGTSSGNIAHGDNNRKLFCNIYTPA